MDIHGYGYNHYRMHRTYGYQRNIPAMCSDGYDYHRMNRRKRAGVVLYSMSSSDGGGMNSNNNVNGYRNGTTTFVSNGAGSNMLNDNYAANGDQNAALSSSADGSSMENDGVAGNTGAPREVDNWTTLMADGTNAAIHRPG